MSSLTQQLHAIGVEINHNISPESMTVMEIKGFPIEGKKIKNKNKAYFSVIQDHHIALIIQKSMNNFRLDSAHMELMERH